VFALGRGGSLRWTSLPAAFSTPILGADGTVYVSGADHRGSTVAALDSQGRLLWDYVVPTGDFWHPTLAIGVDGTVFAVTTDPIVLYAITEKNSTNGGFAGSPWPTARGNRANNGRAGGGR
jgi:outer membrane protein assembly factor BamB